MTTQTHKEIKAELKARKQSKSTVFDRLWQGLSIGLIVCLAGYELLRHISAVYPANLILAGIAIAFLLYTALAPEFRG